MRSFVSSATLIYGVVENIDPTTMLSGWSLCYNGTYDVVLNSSLLDSILRSCNRSKLLIGCRPVNETLISLAATGDRADVLYNCSTTPTCVRNSNGVLWYYSTNYSWGFAPLGSTVNRISCDTGRYIQNSKSFILTHTLTLQIPVQQRP